MLFRYFFASLVMLLALAGSASARGTLESILPEIRAQHPGRLSDAEPWTDTEGRTHYRIKWMTPEGRILYFNADADTGRYSSSGGDDNGRGGRHWNGGGRHSHDGDDDADAGGRRNHWNGDGGGDRRGRRGDDGGRWNGGGGDWRGRHNGDNNDGNGRDGGWRGGHGGGRHHGNDN